MPNRFTSAIINAGKAKLKQLLQNAGAFGAARGQTIDQRMARVNRWREQFNPLAGLTMPRARQLIESYRRGEFADLMWTYQSIEEADADLFALVERRTSAILEMDWTPKVVSEQKRGKDFDETLAEEQASALREAYDRIDNYYEAVEHFAMATFRGFSHVEKHRNEAGEVIHLEPLDQWNVVRDGIYGQWKYNPGGQGLSWEALPENLILEPQNWIVRVMRRHVNRIGLIKFIRQNLSQKDWDAFIEIYGIPGVIITGPASVPKDKEAEYEAAAEAVAKGGSGHLPFGSTVTISDGPRGTNPFKEHLQFLQQQIVLAGTGGLLTMLTQSGSGTLAGEAHTDTFKTIARAEARRISEVFQKQLDAEILEAAFPGRPRLAYVELAANEEQDIGDIIEHAAELRQAGYLIDVEELSEKTGYTLSELLHGYGAMPEMADPALQNDPHQTGQPPMPLRNRAAGVAAALAANVRPRIVRAFASDLQPVFNRLERILQINDPEILANRLRALQAELPQLLKDINADPGAAQEIERTLAAAFGNGVEKSKKPTTEGER